MFKLFLHLKLFLHVIQTIFCFLYEQCVGENKLIINYVLNYKQNKKLSKIEMHNMIFPSY